jgi:3-carboxy-cis,cis-muconate cycloisomerase
MALGEARADIDDGIELGCERSQRITVRAARTLLQQALPTTFGLEVAGWLDALLRHRDRLEALRPRLLVIQFGGAAGTLASLGEAGSDVAESLADALGLGLPDLPWHSHRDRIGELAGWLAGLAGTLGKIAGDLALSMQSEVGELFEPAAPGRGGSSTLPHKRNPICSVLVRQAALRAPALAATLFAAMPQEHERAAGAWHAEWETLADLVVTVGGALAHLRPTLAALDVDVERMRAGLDLTHGLILAEAVQMALAPVIGRMDAHLRVEAACRRALAEGRHLREVLVEDGDILAALGADALARLFDPHNYLGAAHRFTDRVLARWRELRQGGR